MTERTKTSSPIALVTGAGGFTGGHLVSYLSKKNIPVRALVRTQEQAEKAKLLGASEVVIADISNKESLKGAFDNISEVYHIAALFRKAGVEDSEYHKVNVEGTKNVFEESISAGVSRIIHCSTVGVLGDIQNPPANENTPYNPGDIYQETKMLGEKLALEYFNSGKVSGVVIRPAMIYGPGDQRTLKLFKKIAAGSFFYVGKGNALVHFVDVRDLAHAFFLAMSNKEQNGEVYIISGRRAKPLSELVSLIADNFGAKLPRIHLPVKPVQWLGSLCEAICIPLKVEPPIFRRRVDFFTKNRSFDFSKAQKELGYSPKKNLSEEIREICLWYAQNGWIDIRVSGEHQKAIMIRDLSGNIKDWNHHAEKSYGWKAKQAIGSVSHSLLRTEFPKDLEEINQHLLETNTWEGTLIHSTKKGKKITVKSHWRKINHPDYGKSVIETNYIIHHSEDEKKKQGKHIGLLPVLPEIFEIIAEISIGGSLLFR
jgi:dihydroflavonol-4-reductase